MKKYQSFLLIILFANCMSVKKHVEKNTYEIIEAIRQNDLEQFKSKMASGRFEEHKESNIIYFNLANKYVNKYLKQDRPSFTADYSTPLVKVSVPIFNGFDSTNGLKEARIEMIFIPEGRLSSNCELSVFSVYEKVDVPYRQFLIKNNLIPDNTDSLIRDSNLIRQVQKTSVFGE